MIQRCTGGDLFLIETEETGMEFGRQSEAVTRIAVHQGFLGHVLAGESGIHPCRIEVGKAFFNKPVHHVFHLFHIHRGGISRVKLRQAHKSKT